MELHLGKERFAELTTFLGDYMTNYKSPVKTDVFMEIRSGMLNISPIGRKCTQQQRDEFDIWDRQTKSRENIVEFLKQKYEGWGLKFSIGGQISIDVFPGQLLYSFFSQLEIS
jgi:phosphomannomutase